MAQQTSQIPAKGLGSLQWSDLLKAFVKSCSGLIVGILIKTLQDKQLPSYAEIEPLFEAVVYFMIGYLGINGATNNVGQMFKRDKQVVVVDKEHLEDLQQKADQATEIKT